MNNCAAHIPPGHTVSSVVAAIESVSRKLAKAYSFGSFTPQDIAQEVAVFSMELLRKGTFDATRPLEAYLLVHARRRLANMKRDLHHRSDSPCTRCAAGDHCCEPGPCPKHAAWSARNLAKASLNKTVDAAQCPPDREPRTNASVVEQAAEASELERAIDAKLPVGLRADYRRLRAGLPIAAPRRRQIQEFIVDLMDDLGLPIDGLDVDSHI